MSRVFWLYEIGDENNGGGVYQGCTGPGAEGIVHRVATEPHDGKPFPAVTIPEGCNFRPRTGGQTDRDFVLANVEMAASLLSAVGRIHG